MLSRRSFSALFGLAPLALPVLPSAARAASSDLYTQAAFEVAQKAGKPTIVHFWAGWCSTCKAQERVLGTLSPEAKYRDLVILSVNIDTQTDVMKAFGVRDRSVILAFKGGKEIDRAIGITSKTAIESFLDKTVA